MTKDACVLVLDFLKNIYEDKTKRRNEKVRMKLLNIRKQTITCMCECSQYSVTSPINVTSSILSRRKCIDHRKCRNTVDVPSSSSSSSFSSSASSVSALLTTNILVSTTNKQNTNGNTKWNRLPWYHFNGCLTFRRLNFLDT